MLRTQYKSFSLRNTLSIPLSIYCFNWRGRRYPEAYLKKKWRFRVQTFDLYANLYETWKTTYNRLEHSLKINRFNLYFECIWCMLVPKKTEFQQSPKKRTWYLFSSDQLVLLWSLVKVGLFSDILNANANTSLLTYSKKQ
jgi:hypothetical protein